MAAALAWKIAAPAAVSEPRFRWERSYAIALASNACAHCRGLGLAADRWGQPTPCNCVLRKIFDACYAQYLHCLDKPKYMSRASLEFLPGRDHNFVWARKEEEYCADFYLVSKRVLDPAGWRVFEAHFLKGGDWRACVPRVGMCRGNYFHAVYRVKARLGKVFAELRPYGLWPLDEYFHGVRGGSMSTWRDAYARAAEYRVIRGGRS